VSTTTTFAARQRADRAGTRRVVDDLHRQPRDLGVRLELRHGAGAIRVERDQADAMARRTRRRERELTALCLAGAGWTDEGDDEGAESGERRRVARRAHGHRTPAPDGAIGPA
jgi:hypothetical protein